MRFEIERADYGWRRDRSSPPVDGAMQDEPKKWFIEINTAEELMALVKRVERDVIVDFFDRPCLTIHDDYVE